MMFFIIAAIGIVLILAVIAGYFHWQLYVLNVQRDKQRKIQQQEMLDKRLKSLNSIQVLSRALLEDQVTPTEASIRISVLLEGLVLPEEEKQHYVAFYKLAEATAHIPILKEWKALSQKEQRRFDKERLKHEEEFRDFVIEAAQTIIKKRAEYSAYIASLTA